MAPKYISQEFRNAMRLFGIKLEYIQKHTPEGNGDIESFHNSIKTDYIWPNEFWDSNDASIGIGKAFSDYHGFKTHSSTDYLPPKEFRRRFLADQAFRERFGKKEVEVTLDKN